MPVQFDSPDAHTGRIVFDDEPSGRIVFDDPSPYSAEGMAASRQSLVESVARRKQLREEADADAARTKVFVGVKNPFTGETVASGEIPPELAAFGAEAIKSTPATGLGVAAASAVTPYSNRIADVLGVIPNPVARGASMAVRYGAPMVAGGLAGIGARMAQDEALPEILPESVANLYQDTAVLAQQNPTSALLGGMVNPFFRPGLPVNSKGMAVPMITGSVGAGIEGARQMAEGDLDVQRLAAAGLGAGLMNRETALGAKIAPNLVAPVQPKPLLEPKTQNLANSSAEIASTAKKGGNVQLQASLNDITSPAPVAEPTPVTRDQRQAELEDVFGAAKGEMVNPKSAEGSAEVFIQEASRLSNQEQRLQTLIDIVSGNDDKLRAQILALRQKTPPEQFAQSLEIVADYRRNPQRYPEEVAEEIEGLVQKVKMDKALTTETPSELNVFGDAIAQTEDEALGLAMVGGTPEELAQRRQGLAALSMEGQPAVTAKESVILDPLPAEARAEYLGKRYLVAEGVGKTVDQWQVKMPGEPRGRTVSADELALEGYSPPSIKPEAQPVAPEADILSNPDVKALSEPQARTASEIGDIVPPDDLSGRKLASRLRQQRGAISASAIAPVAGAGTGGATGYLLTDKRPGETEEEFHARRLANTVGGALTGLGATVGSGALLAKAGRKSPSSQISLLNQELGLAKEIKKIDPNMSDLELRLRRLKNQWMRDDPRDKLFNQVSVDTRNRIKADLDSTVSTLNEIRRKVVTGYKTEPERQAAYGAIQDALQDISKVDALPVGLQDDVLKIFKTRADNSTRLAALEGLTDATKESIAENGGNYLARHYAIFDLKNEMELRAYQRAIPKEDTEAALDAIQELWKPVPKTKEEQKLTADLLESVANDPINAVQTIKSMSPWMTDGDAAKVAAWVRAGKQAGNAPVRALYLEVVNPSDVSRTQARFLLGQFLDRNNFQPFSMGRKQIGGKDVTALFHKKEIDPRLRKVLGEVKDPLRNAYRSVDNQVQLIQRDREQREMVALGEAMGMMTRDPDVAAANNMQPMVKSSTTYNSPYDNWDGVFVNPVFRDEFITKDPAETGPILNSVKAATALFKWMKIIPNPDSRMVNLFGAYANNIMNARALNPMGEGYRSGLRSLLTEIPQNPAWPYCKWNAPKNMEN